MKICMINAAIKAPIILKCDVIQAGQSRKIIGICSVRIFPPLFFNYIL